jgi:hypothetical protein
MDTNPFLYSFGNAPTDDSTALTVTSTSAQSADVSPILLNEKTDLIRLRFLPKIVTNRTKPANNVEGTFTYERKGKGDDVFPLDCGADFVSRQTVKKDDALKLRLDTNETKNLFEGLKKLYAAADDMGGIPSGTTTYVAVDKAARTLLDLLRKDPATAHMIADSENFELIQELLKLLTQGTSRHELHDILEGLEDSNLQSLSASLSVERLQRVHDEFRENLDNESEQYWQKFFERNAWIISQIFSVPCTLYEHQAYVGGKSINGTGGNLPDFLYANKLTKNLAIVEIKTPKTHLLGQPYRENSYSMSKEFSGAISQVLSYKQSLLNAFSNFYMTSGGKIEAFSPQCVVVLGNTIELQSDRTKMESFENFRACLNGVTVLTYDELFGRIDDLLKILVVDDQADGSSVIDAQEGPDSNGIPF